MTSDLNDKWVLKDILYVEFIDANGNRQDLNYKGPVSLYVKEDETNGRTVQENRGVES